MKRTADAGTGGGLRVARLAHGTHARWSAVILAAFMLIAGAVAAVLAIVGPHRRPEANAILAIVAALGLGIGAGMLGQVLRSRGPARHDDLVRLLAGTLDDTYLLLVAPRLPGVPAEVEALLVGPPGVRVIVARRWNGRYRVRAHRWEFDARGRRGWIPCLTNPSADATAARNAVAAWARSAGHDTVPLEPAIAFPDRHSRVTLQEPDVEVITTDNAPWWANATGRVQRLTADRVTAFAESVIDASASGAETQVSAAASGRRLPDQA